LFLIPSREKSRKGAHPVSKVERAIATGIRPIPHGLDPHSKVAPTQQILAAECRSWSCTTCFFRSLRWQANDTHALLFA
jgi:hypothetical protein